MPDNEKAVETAAAPQLETEEDFSNISLDDLAQFGIDLEETKEVELAEDLTGFGAGFPDWDLHPPVDIDKIHK